MAEIPKTYDPTAVEPKWYQRWLERGYFHADAKSEKPPFSIVIPPPNITGVLTLGHVLNNTIQDILARRARMLGHEVLWLPGTDHAGLATQTAVEKALRKTEKITRHDLGREEFVRRTWEWREKHGRIIFEQLKRLGCSCDWARERFTLDPEYARAVQQVFVDLHAKGLIYRGRRMINWDPAALTALSDEEVIATKQKSTLYYVRYEVVEKPGRFLEVATTRPETIMADVAVAVHPKDERYRALIGHHVWRPLERKQLPIIGDDTIDAEFGTGVLKVTPAHDKVDFEIGQRHKLPIIDVLHPDGRINCPAVPELDRLDRFEARKKAADILAGADLLAKAEPYENSVGFSERAGVPIEPRLSDQWFLRYPKTEEALAAVRDHFIRFFPAHWEKVYAQWLENIQDWCISRQVWWGHRIPAWSQCIPQERLEMKIPLIQQAWDEVSGGDLKELRTAAFQLAHRRGILNSEFRNADTGWDIWVQKSSLQHAFSNRGLANIKLVPALPKLIQSALLVSSEMHDPPAPDIRAVHKFVAALRLGDALFRVKFVVKELPSARKLYDHQSVELYKEREPDGKYPPEAHPLAEKLAHRPASGSGVTLAELLGSVNGENSLRVQLETPGDGWVQDEDTLDTWFSSWLWAYQTMDPATRAKFYPTSVLVTAPDIIFFWVARMIIAGLEFKPGKSRRAEDNIPFRDVYFTGLIRDRSGRKMSKSLGNSPDPLELIAKFGADGLRFGLMRIAPSGQDIRFDEKQIEEGRNFATKLWNAARFRQMHGPSEAAPQLAGHKLSIYAAEVLARLDAAIAAIEESYREYRFNEVVQQLYDFFWNDYCDWFVEAAKTDIFSDEEGRKKSALAVMDHVLSAVLRLLHPFMPHITEELWNVMGFGNPDGTIQFEAPPRKLQGENLHHEKVAAVYGTVQAGRNLRAESRVPSNQKAKFVLKSSAEWIAREVPTLSRLLNAEEVVLRPEYAGAAGVPVAAAPLGELFLLLETGDPVAERERLDKEIARLQEELRTVNEKLSKSSFVDRAPAAVVEEHRRRKADFAQRLSQLSRAREALQ